MRKKKEKCPTIFFDIKGHFEISLFEILRVHSNTAVSHYLKH